MLKIGVIGFQGDVIEHIEAMKKAIELHKRHGTVLWVRKKEDLADLSALIIPGGESTTISRLIERRGMRDSIIEMAENGVPIMGTCAGCILMAKVGDEEVIRSDTRLLSLMDMEVQRNAFGRQRESFEADIEIEGIGKFHAIFIRAPLIKRVWGKCKAMAYVDEGIVMAVQGNLLAMAFHPELGQDYRIHHLFLQMI